MLTMKPWTRTAMFITKGRIPVATYLFCKSRKFLFLLLILPLFVSAQTHTQSIRGVVYDNDSKAPLPGANVVVIASNPAIGVATDEKGNFTLNEVPAGRQTIAVSFLGYNKVVIPNIQVSTGKEPFLEIFLEEIILTTDEVVITARRDKDKALNSMASISAKTFSIEETQRYAGGFNDLSRMTESFAGVSSMTGETNEIVIRGNSPRGLLWQLEGIKISNPNHFPRGTGSSGGGISILTAAIITNSDFFTGAFPAEYGNALSGVFEINLRNGNNTKREHALQIGAIGMEAVVEGPFVKSKPASYLINYRYSTLKLFDIAGIKLVDNTVVPAFQDLAFNLNFPTKRIGRFNLFGIAGKSSAGEKASRDSSLWEYNTDRYDEIETHRMAAVGLKHFIPLSDHKTYIKAILLSDLAASSVSSDSLDNSYSLHKVYSESFSYPNLRASLQVNHKLNSSITLRGGCIASLLQYSINSEAYDKSNNRIVTLEDNEGSAGLLQAYFQGRYKTSRNIEINAGLHALYFLLNGNGSIEPRIGIRYTLNQRSTFSIGSGLHSQIEPLNVYFFQSVPGLYTNKNLTPGKSWHGVAGYSRKMTENLLLRTEVYYQYLFDIPSDTNSSGIFSMINYSGGNVNIPLEGTGKGRNYGIELTLERFFQNNMYFLVTTSVFDSWYTAPNNQDYRTFYAGNYIMNAVAGKEFPISSHGTAGVSLKALYKGGNRILSIDEEASSIYKTEIYDLTNAYTEKTPDFIRIDAGLSYRQNFENISLLASVDFQNLLNRKNIVMYRFNTNTNKIYPVYALPFIPVINIRLEF